MSTLNDFAKYMFPSMTTRHLIEAVAEGMWPFKPGYVNLMLEEKLPYSLRDLLIETKHGNARIPIHDQNAYTHLDDLELAVASEAFNHFRFRLRLEPEANIILGEE